MLERFDMLADRRFEVLSHCKVDVLPARVAKNVAEELNLATPLLRKVDLISRPVHLSLRTRAGFKADRQRLGRSGAKLSHALGQYRVTSRVTHTLQLLLKPNHGDSRITLE